MLFQIMSTKDEITNELANLIVTAMNEERDLSSNEIEYFDTLLSKIIGNPG